MESRPPPSFVNNSLTSIDTGEYSILTLSEDIADDPDVSDMSFLDFNLTVAPPSHTVSKNSSIESVHSDRLCPNPSNLKEGIDMLQDILLEYKSLKDCLNQSNQQLRSQCTSLKVDSLSPACQLSVTGAHSRLPSVSEDHSDGAGDRSRPATNTNPLLETLQQQIHQQTRQLIEQKERQEKEFMDRQLYQMDSWDISWKGSSLGRGDSLKISLSPDDNLQTSVKSQSTALLQSRELSRSPHSVDNKPVTRNQLQQQNQHQSEEQNQQQSQPQEQLQQQQQIQQIQQQHQQQIQQMQLQYQQQHQHHQQQYQHQLALLQQQLQASHQKQAELEQQLSSNKTEHQRTMSGLEQQLQNMQKTGPRGIDPHEVELLVNQLDEVNMQLANARDLLHTENILEADVRARPVSCPDSTSSQKQPCSLGEQEHHVQLMAEQLAMADDEVTAQANVIENLLAEIVALKSTCTALENQLMNSDDDHSRPSPERSVPQIDRSPAADVCRALDLPLTEKPLQGWRAHLVNRRNYMKIVTGRLHITPRFLCFRCDGAKQGSSQHVIIPLETVTRIQKARPNWNPFSYFKNMSLEVHVHGSKQAYVFGMIWDRDRCYTRLMTHGQQSKQPYARDYQQ